MTSLITSLFTAKASDKPVCVAPEFYDLIELDSRGQNIPFSMLKGKVVFGINIASDSNATEDGYKLIRDLCALKESGSNLEILLFPCNQFGVFKGQEPGTEGQIRSFNIAQGVTGAILLSKADVNGENIRPTYAFLKKKQVLPETISWDFKGIFIIDADGTARLPIPNDDEIVKFVTELAVPLRQTAMPATTASGMGRGIGTGMGTHSGTMAGKGGLATGTTADTSCGRGGGLATGTGATARGGHLDTTGARGGLTQGDTACMPSAQYKGVPQTALQGDMPTNTQQCPRY